MDFCPAWPDRTSLLRSSDSTESGLCFPVSSKSRPYWLMCYITTSLFPAPASPFYDSDTSCYFPRVRIISDTSALLVFVISVCFVPRESSPPLADPRYSLAHAWSHWSLDLQLHPHHCRWPFCVGSCPVEVKPLQSKELASSPLHALHLAEGLGCWSFSLDVCRMSRYMIKRRKNSGLMDGDMRLVL